MFRIMHYDKFDAIVAWWFAHLGPGVAIGNINMLCATAQGCTLCATRWVSVVQGWEFRIFVFNFQF